MIVGTAGHIDHGKTTLVRALTGVDTDRLPEEKARGISIELGYAFLDVPGSAERIGFVDVPGHERLVHTMLAGATGIDFALLLVAADDGVMPQTREHVAVLSMLGITRGAVVVTKTDRVDAARVDAVVAEAEALIASTTLAGSAIHRVSATTGAGVARLRDALFSAARAMATDSAHRHQNERGPDAAHVGERAFRLAVDRSFTLAGIGTVVTGTVHAGHIKVGDTLAITPSQAGLTARVRSLHAQDAKVDAAHAGQRCAVALVGAAKDDVRRGQWLTTPAVALSTRRIDCTLTLWAGEAKALRSGTPVHVHLGASATMGSVALLAALPSSDVCPMRGLVTPVPADTLLPGATAFVQLVLHEPVAAWHGDRVVLRDASASRTMAGGVVLDPFAPARYRRTPQRLGELVAWTRPSNEARLAALVDATPNGVSVARWAMAEALSDEARSAAMRGVASGHLPNTATARLDPMLGPMARDSRRAGAPLDLPASVDALGVPPLTAIDATLGTWLLGAGHRQALESHVVDALRAFHAREPDLLGPDAARLRRLVAPRLPEPLWRELLLALQAGEDIAVRGAFVHLPAHGLRLSATDERLAQRIAPVLAQGSFEGVWARDLARDTRESEALLRTTLTRLAQRGELHQVVRDLFFANATMNQLAAHVRAVSEAHGGVVTAARFRDSTGLGRKRAIQILEYFDRIGLLRRVGDEHRLRSDTALFTAMAA